MTQKSDVLNNQSQPEELNYLSKKEVQEINEGFELLQIQSVPQYTDPYQFSKNLQKVSNLQYEGLRFFTSGSTLAPKF